jgi:hypothetical protein
MQVFSMAKAKKIPYTPAPTYNMRIPIDKIPRDPTFELGIATIQPYPMLSWLKATCHNIVPV